MKKILFAIFLTFLSSKSFSHDGNNGWVTISNFDLWSNTYTEPQIRVNLNGDTYYNPAGICSSVDSYMVSTALTEKQQDRIYSMLLAAVTAKKSLRVRLDTNYCENNRPRILNVVIN
ncbi:MAG: hypothetical protein IPK77_01865 [Cellvibrio sp.]|nr:hypothetical protein [Cellvibrio sp.]